jgi:L-alanine-DL-glutamate epimerase-like enolase superfamily enzyme
MSLIAKIETFRVWPRWLFVRIETTDGLIGWGEASLEGHAEAVDGAMEHIRDRLIGADAVAHRGCVADYVSTGVLSRRTGPDVRDRWNRPGAVGY